MTDQEIDLLLEAAFYEDANDRDGLTPEFLSDIALRVHRDLLETYGLELQTRGSVTEDEIKQIEAMKQALLAYNILSAQRHAQTAVRKTQAMGPEERSTLADTMARVLLSLALLDEVAPLAKATLAGLGLPASILEFEAGGGRIKLDYASCMLATDETVQQLLSACSPDEER